MEIQSLLSLMSTSECRFKGSDCRPSRAFLWMFSMLGIPVSRSAQTQRLGDLVRARGSTFHKGVRMVAALAGICSSYIEVALRTTVRCAGTDDGFTTPFKSPAHGRGVNCFNCPSAAAESVLKIRAGTANLKPSQHSPECALARIT